MNLTESMCSRCGSSAMWEDCTNCDDGIVPCWNCDALYDEDCQCDDGGPRLCDICDAKGGWWTCMSSRDWCEEHPLPGKEGVKRGEIEDYARCGSEGMG